MTDLKKYPKLASNCHYYLIKTNNGRYYASYKEHNHVSLYSIFEEGELTTIKKKWLNQFKQEVKLNDFVLIPNHRNQLMSIGMITSPSYIDHNQVYKKVKWVKEMKVKEISLMLKYLHQGKQIQKLSVSDAEEIERMLYSVFHKNDSTHFIFQVQQEDAILYKSLYGFYHLLLEGKAHEELQIKVTLKSPGIIELITQHLDVIYTIFKVIKIIHLLTRKKQTYSLEEKEFLKAQEILIQKYYDYQVDKLKIKAPPLK